MLASELIAELQEQIDKHGDLVVKYSIGGGDTTPVLITAYTNDGQTPNFVEKAVEIYIH